MAVASLATDCTFGDYAAAASYIYQSWTAETSDTSSIDSWEPEMYRHSLQPQYRNQLFTPSFCSIECQRGRKHNCIPFNVFGFYTLKLGNQMRLIDTVSAQLLTALGTLFYFTLVHSLLVHFLHYTQNPLIYVSQQMVGTLVSIPYILP